MECAMPGATLLFLAQTIVPRDGRGRNEIPPCPASRRRVDNPFWSRVSRDIRPKLRGHSRPARWLHPRPFRSPCAADDIPTKRADATKATPRPCRPAGTTRDREPRGEPTHGPAWPLVERP